MRHQLTLASILARKASTLGPGMRSDRREVTPRFMLAPVMSKPTWGHKPAEIMTVRVTLMMCYLACRG